MSKNVYFSSQGADGKNFIAVCNIDGEYVTHIITEDVEQVRFSSIESH